MPVLLAPEQAPTLQELLAKANTVRLDCKPVNAEHEPTLRIRGLGSLFSAGPDEISFFSNPKLQAQLPQSKASRNWSQAAILSCRCFAASLT
jgi:UDP-3-O-[3-hydroxymyristoyl] glucosamine N-acyltransferase